MKKTLKIAVLDKSRESDYEAFLLRRECALFYHSLRFRDFIADLLGCEVEYRIALDEGGAICGALPLMKKEGSLGAVYNSLPFYGSNGGIMAESAWAREALIAEYNVIVSANNVGASTLIANPIDDCGYEEPEHKIVYNQTDERIGQFTELVFDGDIRAGLDAKIDAVTRRNVNKAVKSNVTVEVDNANFEFLKKVHMDNMSGIGGRSKPDRFFEIVSRHFRPDLDYKIYIAKKDNTPVAALLLFYFNNIVEYYVPVIVEEFRTFQPLALIVHTAMIDAAKGGCRLWNWGGTWLTQDGVYKFKKKWGTVEKKYRYFVQINNPAIYESSKERLLGEYGNFYVAPFGCLKVIVNG